MKLSVSDEAKLKKAHPDLVKVVRRCAEITDMPFQIGETARSVEQQEKNIAKGVSQTMHSRHIVSKDGLSRAVDLLAAPGGKITWSWPPYYKLAAAMRKAAIDCKIDIEWGAVWDTSLNALTANLEHEQAAYVARQKAKGRKAFADGPHFQLPWAKYP